jgi:glycosyltransferase involved in cell wall biosynthesis
MSLYKKEKPEYLRAALESMIHQTVTPDEIVLVEDGPLTEELYAVVDEYKTCLHLVINEVNTGLGIALNKGLSECRNELVARMDTDDISELDRCEKQLRYFDTHPFTTILGGQIEEFINNSTEATGRRIVPLTDSELKKYMKNRCPFNHMTVMFKKSSVINAGNYQDWFWNEDYYLWIRLALENGSFANLPDVLVHARISSDTYERRGGKRYYKSEIGIQKYMFDHGIIGFWRFLFNCSIRLLIELLLPSRIRGCVIQLTTRKR